ncbi:Ldh family oxidoreductase [Albibacterium sp.]|uniref:Ldh family oxidoreductase n=1 Tax=Albibacterium sp. TaxID=2952885 RepID=UPI002B57E61D|nr:Ldh family oxidoreductase [Albibacterium sp.]HUH20171.1 Ldh family oxidoreductase [Albibacterium sp.]
MEIATERIAEKKLREFTQDVFLSIGCSKSDAELAADVLLKADLRGIDSHGVARLTGYVRLWDKKRINPTPQIKIIHETPSTATIDGDAGLGLVVAPFAMKIALEKAEKCGSGWIAIKNSNHFGIAGYHALMAVEKEMIGMAMTNASPLVTPTFSKERMLGTNPICYTFPAGEFPPIVVDMATSTAANGKLEVAKRKNQPIPNGWAQDVDGKPSVDPGVVTQGGSLLPLGGDRDHGSHKGYGLSASVDIFSAVLSGANYGPWAPPFVAYLNPLNNLPGDGLGHFLGAWRVDAFRPIEDYKKNIDQWIARFKVAERIDESQPVIIPGEPEYEAELINRVEGIPLVQSVKDDLNTLAVRFGIEAL